MRHECEALQDYIVNMRRELHRIPELGFDLPMTRSLICSELGRLGISYGKNGAGSGIIGEIKGCSPRKTVLLRADMDALPVTENTGLPFSSANCGNMHACGHDAHAAMLIGALRVLNTRREGLQGNVRFIFQSAEEICKGAEAAIKEGVLDGVDAVFGTHIGTLLGTEIPSGTLIAAPGCVMASFDRFTITVRGRGCHGSSPENGVDPVTIAANIVLALQEIAAREVSGTKTAVITIGMINGGFACNVIPSEVVISGTMRALESGVREYIAARAEEISKGIAAAYRGDAEFVLDRGAPPLVNDAKMAGLAAGAAKKILGETNVLTAVKAPTMTSEDFAFYLTQKPGAFLFLSSSDHGKGTDKPHHSPDFDIDESVLWKGSAVLAETAEAFLNNGD